MGTTIVNSAIFKKMEEWAPLNLAYDWDNVGLQIGSPNHPVKKVMITLDVLESVVDEAIEKKVDLIIAHHPLLFKSLKQIDVDTPKGRDRKSTSQNYSHVAISDGCIRMKKINKIK